MIDGEIGEALGALFVEKYFPPEARARRRHLELQQKGENLTYEQVLEDVKTRDEQDSSRAVAPLRVADDAVVVDTTHDDLAASLERLYAVAENARGKRA